MQLWNNLFSFHHVHNFSVVFSLNFHGPGQTKRRSKERERVTIALGTRECKRGGLNETLYMSEQKNVWENERHFCFLLHQCSSSSAWRLDCCSKQWRLCAHLKGLEEGPPEAEAHPQRAGPTPSSTVPAQVDAPKVPAFYTFPSSTGDTEGE